MTVVSATLAAHLIGDVTTLAHCWGITVADGAEFFFTDHGRDLVFEGNVYKASSGYSRTAIADDASLSVDNLDAEGVFDSATITEAEKRAGLFDRAEVRIFLVDWADPSMGSLRMHRGWFAGGVLTWKIGANAGRSIEVKSWTQVICRIELFLPVGCAIGTGDAFRIHPGCDKRLATCIYRFANVLNFRSQPHVPGQDLLMSYPDAR